ncbi:sulfatase-like hydrolase/transferase [Chloroflexi bacterium TSY]|nr:sulfatase-like hydrolase/transferase [Chloroflexi bacterium TSY]
MSDQPNVLLISTDHWPASLMGCAGHPAIQTPTLDQIAANGIRFTNAYAECPVCIPARRTLMTGTTPRIHGDRLFQETLPMPNLPTLAQTFRNAGYQAYAVGKLHVYPQRNRIGFDDVILDEEGRQIYGVIDDYELFLGDQGYAGRYFEHGMSNNEYSYRPWFLPEETHATNWAANQMCRVIKRKDPERAAFWYLSFRHPHPPLLPMQSYLDLYRDMKVEIDAPYHGEWTEAPDPCFSLQMHCARGEKFTHAQIHGARLAFYALCTQIDHQLRVVIGTLREEGLLDNTIICFTSDHGDMLGNHGMWAKRLFYENSANIPMLLMGVAGDERVGHHRVDDRLVGWQDVMPTLLDLAGIEIPESVEGISMVGEQTRDWFYGEIDEGPRATRMIRDERYKLIYYSAGNHRQLFDMEEDPQELVDLSDSSEHSDVLERLTNILMSQLYGGDEEWIQDGKLVGLPDNVYVPGPNRGLTSQRGAHWPPPPASNMPQIEWYSIDNQKA